MFNALKVKDDIIQWIRDFFKENGENCNAIIGISGGKDSSVVAKLCVEALGKDRVIGVLMPNGNQHDIDVSKRLVKLLGIKSYEVNIRTAVENLIDSMYFGNIGVTKQTRTNIPARIRMSTLYAVAQSLNGRVVNTSNFSEYSIGYCTRYGDSVGDFCPILDLTASEVVELGLALDMPDEFCVKTPEDGLSGKTDEENIGFTYKVLDKYLRTGECDDEKTKIKIDNMIKNSEFKRNPIPYYKLKG